MRIGMNALGSKLLYNQRNAVKAMQQSMERLSTGLRINSAADDSAGLMISERLKASINEREMSINKYNGYISTYQTADGYLASVIDQVQRLRELSVQSQNGTYSPSDLAAIQLEGDQLIENIQHTIKTATFNNVSLFDGNHPLFQKSEFKDLSQLGLDGLSLADPDSLKVLDTALDTLTSYRSAIGSSINVLEFRIDNESISSINESAALSQITECDMAAEFSNLAKYELLAQTSNLLISKYNQNLKMILQLIQD